MKTSRYIFKLRVDLSGQSFSHSMNFLFNENDITGMIEAANMKRFNDQSPFIGLIFDGYCGEDDAASVSKSFAAYAD